MVLTCGFLALSYGNFADGALGILRNLLSPELSMDILLRPRD